MMLRTLTRLLPLCLALAALPAQGQDTDASVAVVDMTTLESEVQSGWRTVAESALKQIGKDPSQALPYAHLARALEHGGKPYAALATWVQGLERSPSTVAPLLPRALALSEELGEDAWLGGKLTDAFGLPMEADTRARLALAVARHHFGEASWGDALAMIALVPEDSAWGLDAAVLRGTVLAQQKRYTDALPLMLTAYERARQEDRSERYVATLAMNAARTLFAAKAYAQAVAYYDKVPRTDPAWPRAQVEAAWAAFRAEDMDTVLGRLHTNESPFFHDFYQPEAAMLRAQALYLLCKFPATTAAIDDFQARYQPILDALEVQVPQLADGGALEQARTVLDGGTPALPSMVLREVSWDGRLDQQLDTVAQGVHELTSLDWAPPARDALRARVDALSDTADGRLRAELQDKQAELADLLSNIELTRVDLLSLEADLYQRAAATGEAPIQKTEVLAARKELRRKGKRVWPFQGEYWIDELGSYQVRTLSECPEGLARGE